MKTQADINTYYVTIHFKDGTLAWPEQLIRGISAEDAASKTLLTSPKVIEKLKGRAKLRVVLLERAKDYEEFDSKILNENISPEYRRIYSGGECREH